MLGIPKQIGPIHEVSAAQAEAAIRDNVSDGLLSALEYFGERMFDEVFGRVAHIDTKATSVLGWSVAALAFLLYFIRDPINQNDRGIAIGAGVAAVLAGLASVCAGLALRVIDTPVPSESDWFRANLFGNTQRLRAYHLLALLETHQSHNRLCKSKGEYLWCAQLFLVCATISMGLVIVLG